ncbi:MAG: DUF4288 domain-containing protein [Pseudomonadales bacterium]|nr:DUF4288 domain-containing protein [Pseudomonadales bacterium]
MPDKNVSPVGWYIGSYIIRFTELENPNDNDESRCYAWENTRIIKAKSFSQAYDKILKVAKLDTKPYKGGPEGIPVQWVFEGVTELLPVYEEIEDGSELMYKEINRTKLKNLRKLIKSKNELTR